MHNKVRMIFLIGLIWIAAIPALAQTGANEKDQKSVITAGNMVLALVKEGKLNTVWNNHVSDFVKQRVDKNQFLLSLSYGRVNVGQLTSSSVVNVTYSSKDPGSGYTGDIYTVTFRDTYERGEFFDSLVFIRESDGKWRLSGLGSAPVPTD